MNTTPIKTDSSIGPSIEWGQSVFSEGARIVATRGAIVLGDSLNQALSKNGWTRIESLDIPDDRENLTRAQTARQFLDSQTPASVLRTKPH